MKKALVAMVFLTAAPVFCAELSPVVQTEIAYLFSHMENSGCEFNRNDSWHSASAARAHIQKKYDYLMNRDLLTSTESFIKVAASESSISKQPYMVRCPGLPIVGSALWFQDALEKYRKTRLNTAR